MLKIAQDLSQQTQLDHVTQMPVRDAGKEVEKQDDIWEVSP